MPLLRAKSTKLLRNGRKKTLKAKKARHQYIRLPSSLALQSNPSHVNHILVFSILDLTKLISYFEAGSVGPRRLDISYPTTEFSKLVKVWEHFNEATMGIVVRHIKRFVVLMAWY